MLTGSHLDSVLDGGAYDGPLGVASRAGGDRRAPRARVRAGEADRGQRLRRGGGVAVRPGLPGLAARGRDDGVVGRAGAAGPGRRLPARRPRRGRAGAPTTATSRGGCADRIECFVELHVEQGRDLVDRGAAVGVGERDRAARALPLRLRRAGQPCRHHPDGGPARPDAHLRHDRPGRQQAGAARGGAGHLRAGRGVPNGTNAVPVAGHGLAGRAVRRPTTGSPRWSPPSRSRAGSGRTATVRRSRSRPSPSPARRLRPGPGPADRRRPRGRRLADHPHHGRARRGHPVRGRDPHRHAVRPQPDRGVALARRARRDGRLPGRGLRPGRHPRTARRDDQ